MTRSTFISGLLLLLGAAVGAGSCSNPSKPTQTVDSYPDGPKIICPAAPATFISPTGAAVVVIYGTPTATGGAPPVSTNCAPQSGSTFNVGSTTVACTATDARQRTDACSFTVLVQSPPRISITSFVAFGDSITAGEDGQSAVVASDATSVVRPRVFVPPSQQYPNVLQQLLRGRYTAQTPTVANAGLPEEHAGDPLTLVRFNNTLASASYGAVLIMEGTNDIYDRDASKIPIAVQGLRNMIQSAKRRNVMPFLATIPPMVPNTLRGLAWSLVPAMNSGIRNLAASEGITLVDIEAAFGTNYQQYIGVDGLHPNVEGYAKIADTFFGVLKSALETQPATINVSSLPVRPRRSR